MSNHSLKDLIQFRTNVTPMIMKIVFWIGVFLNTILSIVGIFGGATSANGGPAVLASFILLFLGPVLLRIFAELSILFFRMQETLEEINENLKKESQLKQPRSPF